jgi:hypothetical protein
MGVPIYPGWNEVKSGIFGGTVPELHFRSIQAMGLVMNGMPAESPALHYERQNNSRLEIANTCNYGAVKSDPEGYVKVVAHQPLRLLYYESAPGGRYCKISIEVSLEQKSASSKEALLLAASNAYCAAALFPLLRAYRGAAVR